MTQLTRRKFILKIFLSFVALYGAISLVPRKWFLWFVVGRRLESERKILEKIASNLPPTCSFPCGEEKARVVVVRNPDMSWEQEERFAPGGWVGRPNQDQVSQLVDRAILSLTRTESIPEAYGKIFRPDDRVGIKVIWTGHLEVIDPILRGLMCIGIPPERITLFDFRQARRKWWSPSERPGDEITLPAREPGDRTYNEYKGKYGVSISGGNYHPQLERVGSQKAQFEEILYQCTALINVPSLKTHSLAESTLTLKNHQGSNSKPHKLHASWDVSCALLNHVPMIREKTRLVVCDATAPLYHKGPITRHSVFTWKYNGILASRDPVALDTVGISILKKKRRKEELPSDFPRSHDQLRNAEMLRLGRHHLEWIEREDILVG